MTTKQSSVQLGAWIVARELLGDFQTFLEEGFDGGLEGILQEDCGNHIDTVRAILAAPVEQQGKAAKSVTAKRIREAMIADADQPGVNIREGRFGKHLAALCVELDTAEQQGEPIWLFADYDGYTGWTDRWDVAKHLPYSLQKAYRQSQPPDKPCEVDP